MLRVKELRTRPTCAPRHSQPLRLSDRATEPTSANRFPSFTTLTWLRILPVRGAVSQRRADAPASEARMLAPGGVLWSIIARCSPSTLQVADEAIRLKLSNISFRPHEAVHPSNQVAKPSYVAYATSCRKILLCFASIRAADKSPTGDCVEPAPRPQGRASHILEQVLRQGLRGHSAGRRSPIEGGVLMSETLGHHAQVRRGARRACSR